MCRPNTSQIQHVGVRNQQRRETQLYTVRGPETTKTLGFSRFLVDLTSMKQVHFSMLFQRFGGTRSTQPTLL